MTHFYGVFPLFQKKFLFWKLDELTDPSTSYLDMICDSQEAAEYMVRELNARRFYNVPSAYPIDRAPYCWSYIRLNEYRRPPRIIAWIDTKHNMVYAQKPPYIKTKKISLNHHYCGGF